MEHADWADPAQRGTRREVRHPSQTEGAHGYRMLPVSVIDCTGDRRQGVVLRVPRWEDGLGADLQQIPGDFRIVVLEEPPPSSILPPRATVLCAPARQAGRSSVRETAAANEASPRPSARLLTTVEARLLSEGRLYAPVELSVTAQEVFAAGTPRLDLLAQDLLASEALADYLGPLGLALSAPDAPPRRSFGELMTAVLTLVGEAQASIERTGPAGSEEASRTLERATELAAGTDAQEFLASARRLYPRVPALLEDIYLLRALVERPADALEALRMRAFVAQALVSPSDRDLWLDRAIVSEQFQFAGLLMEPQRLTAARAALDHFRSRYRARYEDHHRSYWAESARLRARLLEENDKIEALGRLNTLTELGPPVGEGAIQAYRELLNNTSGCSLILGLQEELGEAAVCPACGLRLDQEAATERGEEILQRIDRAIARQMARLSSIAVRRVLERSTDPRVEQFLKVVQASQISSLSDVLDGDLIGYLRRFLVESRIDSVLDPILERLQKGKPARAEEAREALLELARVLERAFRVAGRALPAGKPALQPEAKKAKR